MLTGFVQQDLLYENHKCPCVASAKCSCPKTEIYAFSFENTKVLTCFVYVFELRIQSNWKTVFCGTLWKGFGNTQEDKMFLSLCNVECIYFWWFSKHGWNFAFSFSSVKLWNGFNWCLIPECFGNKFVWSSWKNSLLKKCGCSRCQTLWLVGENSWALCNFWIFLWNS